MRLSWIFGLLAALSLTLAAWLGVDGSGSDWLIAALVLAVLAATPPASGGWRRAASRERWPSC